MDALPPIIELRQYTIRGGRRDAFARLFADQFVTSQEVLDIRMLGWFRDLDDPDRFVWIRGFASMPVRASALAAFYGGDLWKAHRNEANAMIVDSDNVLLLEPSAAGGGVATRLRAMDRAAVATATVHYLDPGNADEFARFFVQRMLPRVEADGGSVTWQLRSLEVPNNFPRLPVRSGDHVFVWLARFDDEPAQQAFSRKWAADPGWRDDASEAVLKVLMRKPEVLRLAGF